LEFRKAGFSIKSPEVLKDLSKGSYRLIICSGAYDAISRQLREMGIGDFRIYVRLIDELIGNESPAQKPGGKYNIVM
jgi:hypothetical protein